jgi:hypothetical protein
MTTILMVYPPLSTTGSYNPDAKSSAASRAGANTSAVGLVQLNSATIEVFAVRAAGMYRFGRKS